MIGILENHAFLRFTFLHNCSFSQDQYLKIHNEVSLEIFPKLPPDCKSGIKTFKTIFSGGIEVAKMQNTPNCTV